MEPYVLHLGGGNWWQLVTQTPSTQKPPSPEFISMATMALSVLSFIPLGYGAPREVMHPGSPKGEEKTGRMGFYSLKDRHTGKSPSLGLEAGLPLWLGKGFKGAATYPPHQYHDTHASCSSNTKQGVSSTLKKTTPTMLEMESRWFCRHCWNLPQTRHSGHWTTQGHQLLLEPTQ